MFLIYLDVFHCRGEFVNCHGSSPRQLCIRRSQLYDGDDDCGNGWDELPETIGQFAY